MSLFKQHAREQNLVRAENCVECFQREFLGPPYSVRKIANVSCVPLVSLKQLTACTLVRQYAGCTKFQFKIKFKANFCAYAFTHSVDQE